MSGIEANPEASDFEDLMRKGADKIIALTKAKGLLVTLDKYGMLFVDKERVIFVPSKAKKIIDVIGAGDATFPAFLLAFNRG